MAIDKRKELRYFKCMKHRKERNWSQYNQKLKNIARITFLISEEAIVEWTYEGEKSLVGRRYTAIMPLRCAC